MSFDFQTSNNQAEADPMADFLARERANAGALSGDVDLFGAAPAGGEADGGKDFAASASNFPSLDGDDDAAAPAPAAPTPAPPADERQQFEQDFPELDDGEVAEEVTMPSAPAAAAPAAATSSFGQNGTNGYASQSRASLDTYRAPDPYGSQTEEEPEPVREWKSRQADDIARRDAEAERKKGEAISKAERDIDNFYAEYNKKKEARIKANKESEAEFLESHQSELASGTTWARVTKLLEMQNSQSKTIARTGNGAADLTRMKELLLELRREGETAPAAAGY